MPEVEQGKMKPGEYNHPLYNQLFETYFAQYGDHNRAVRAAQTAFDYYASQSSTLDTFNQGVGESEGYLKQILSGDNPLKKQQEQQLAGQVGRLQQKGTRNILNQLSQSGMSRSGAGYGALNDLYGESANTLAQGQLGIDQQDQTQRMDAVAKLLGIQGTRAQLTQTDKDWYEKVKDSSYNQQITRRPDAPESGWMTLVKSLPVIGSIIASFLAPTPEPDPTKPKP